MATAPLFKKDFQSDTWERLRTLMRERVEELRVDLESLENTEQTSATIRGRIAELHKTLALEKAPAEAPRARDQFGRGPVDDTQAPADPSGM